jgi:hypothetical protein
MERCDKLQLRAFSSRRTARLIVLRDELAKPLAAHLA